MGTDKLNIPLNINNDKYANISAVKPATNPAKPMLVKISPEEIKAKRISAYKYLLP